jgi:hypothetical protein
MSFSIAQDTNAKYRRRRMAWLRKRLHPSLAAKCSRMSSWPRLGLSLNRLAKAIAKPYHRDRQQSPAHHGRHRTPTKLVFRQQSGVLVKPAKPLRPHNGTSKSEPRGRKAHQSVESRLIPAKDREQFAARESRRMRSAFDVKGQHGTFVGPARCRRPVALLLSHGDGLIGVK